MDATLTIRAYSNKMVADSYELGSRAGLVVTVEERTGFFGSKWFVTFIGTPAQIALLANAMAA